MSRRLNQRIAARLREMADLLELQGAPVFRPRAYREAAGVVEQLARPVDDIIAEEGREGLVALPMVGRGIASAIVEMVSTGHWSELDRLTGRLDPEALLMTIPGIGPRLARRLHHELQIDTLEDLEQAADEGRLTGLFGLGGRRLNAIGAAVRERLQLVRGHMRAQAHAQTHPRVQTLLELDELYRDKALAGELKLIAPRRFNPRRLAWLPVMHIHRRPWHFTLLYSNTARAHQLHKTQDWVLVFASHDREPDWQCAIVTETRGPLKGKRVVRGLEDACARHYASRVPVETT